MKTVLFTSVLLSLFATAVSADTNENSNEKQRQMFLSTNYTRGTVFQTNDFVAGENKIPATNSYALHFGFTSKTKSVYDYVYGLPYWAIGISMIDLPGRQKDLGRPFSIYLVQGARMFQFTDRLKINYEWNLGMSMNWKPYDRFTNPYNIAIGAPTSVHIAGSIYLKWIASQKFDFNIGVRATHFSNGRSNTPNYGLNLGGVFFGAAYSFDRKEITPKRYPGDETVDFKRRIDHEFSFIVSKQTIVLNTNDNGLVYKYPDRVFRVFGLNYLTVFVNSLRFKWGPGIEMLYDESGGTYAKREKDIITETMVDRIYLGPVKDRISASASMMGELSMPYYSIFVHMGYDVLKSHRNHPDESKFFQVLGVKIYLNDRVYGTFGIRSVHFSRAQFLYWSLGYRIKGKGK